MASINAIIEQLRVEVVLRNTAILALENLTRGNGPAQYQEEPEKIIQPGPEKPPAGMAKYCNQCHHMKPMSAYPANKNCRDGHEGVCKACRRPEKKASGDEKPCKVCGEAKPPEAFPRAPYGSGRIATCAECRAMAFKKTFAAKKASKAKAPEATKPVSDAMLPQRLDPRNRCEECQATFSTAALLAQHIEMRHAG